MDPRSILLAASVALFIALASACGPGPDGERAPVRPCVSPDTFIGDPLAAPELVLLGRLDSGEMIVLDTDGMAMPIVSAPQGGSMVLAGVRARNVSACVDVTAALRDPSSGAIVGLDARPVNLVEAADGSAVPAQPENDSDWANIGLGNGFVAGDPHLLEMTISDGPARTVQASITVLPAY